MPTPVFPMMSSLSCRSLKVFTLARAIEIQILVSVVGVPIQEILSGSKRAPGAPVSGPSGASRAIMASTVPSFGAMA